VRDNAIVFSVEHVRLIITADYVIVPQTGFEASPLANRFAAMVEDSIIEASQERQVGQRCSYSCEHAVAGQCPVPWEATCACLLG
jgi:hypothetical protein